MNFNHVLLKDELKKTISPGPVTYQRRIRFYQNGHYKSDTVTISRYSDGTVILDDGKALFIQRPACLLTRTFAMYSKIKSQATRTVTAMFNQVMHAINHSRL